MDKKRKSEHDATLNTALDIRKKKACAMRAIVSFVASDGFDSPSLCDVIDTQVKFLSIEPTCSLDMPKFLLRKASLE